MVGGGLNTGAIVIALAVAVVEGDIAGVLEYVV
jgi:hypothetical protein